MFKKTPVLIYIAYFLFFAIFFCFKIFQFGFSAKGGLWVWQAYLSVLWWLIGAYIGYWLLTVDRFVDVYFTHPDTKMSIYIKDLVKKNNFKKAIEDLEKYKEHQKNLALRSALFQAIWIPLTFFTLTSTASLFGKAVVMGLGLHLLFDEWEDVKSGKGISWLFWQIKRQISLKEQKIYLWMMTGAFLVFTLMLL